jgi:hypothetical protein
LRSLKSPIGVQRFLDALPYHHAGTAWSPRRVLRERTAHCAEAALFAAAALRVLGFPPLILDLEAEQDDDHVLAVFRVRNLWGAVAKSKFSGLQYREPVYKTTRELVMSYFDQYFNLRGERTLRRYSKPVNLARFDTVGWMTTDRPLWFVLEHLAEAPHHPVLPRAAVPRLNRVDGRVKAGGLVGFRKQ